MSTINSPAGTTTDPPPVTKRRRGPYGLAALAKRSEGQKAIADRTKRHLPNAGGNR